jgi:hypothetical protein
MKKSRRLSLLLFAAALLLTSLACDLGRIIPGVLSFGKAQPEESRRQLYNGIVYSVSVRNEERPMVIHILDIDLNAAGLSLLVTTGDPETGNVSARTTSQFLTNNNLQLAINGDGFSPWFDLGPLGYMPRTGQSVSPHGFAMSRGIAYTEEEDRLPTLYMYNNNYASMDNVVAQRYNAISGGLKLVTAGQAVEGLDDSNADPRTAIGIDQIGQRMVILVVDGRQSGYSEGATMAELAQLFLERNIYHAMNLDGGGSSTLVVQGPDGPEVLNSPIHQGFPGRERPVANHLGFYANP